MCFLGGRFVHRWEVRPAPVIVKKFADDLNSGLLEYKARVCAKIRNDGGGGYVLVEAELWEKGKHWSKTARVFIAPGEVEDVTIEFPEVTVGGPPGEHVVTANGEW